MRRSVVGLALLAGCGYPDYGFVADTSNGTDAGGEDVVVADSGAGDTSSDDVIVDDTSSADTSADADAPVVFGCTGSTAYFCADFNSSTLPDDGWTDKGLAPTSQLLLETTGAHSPPKLLFAKTTASPTTTTNATVSELVTAPSTDREARIDVWIKLDTASFSGKQLYLFKYQRDGAGDGLAFSIDSTGFFLEVTAPGGPKPRITTPVPVGTWFHVRMDAKLLYVNGSAVVWIDDMVTPVASVTGIPTLETDTVNRRLSVGLYVQNATVDVSARYDDISLDWK